MKVNACFVTAIVVITAIFITEVASQNAQKNRPRTTKKPVRNNAGRAIAVSTPVGKPVRAKPVNGVKPGVKQKNGKVKPVAKVPGKKNGNVKGRKPAGKKGKPGKNALPFGGAVSYSMPMYSDNTPPLIAAGPIESTPPNAYDPVDANKLAVVTQDDYDAEPEIENGYNNNNRRSKGGTTKMTKNKYRNRRKHKSEEVEEEEVIVYERNHGGRKNTKGYGGGVGTEEYDYEEYGT